MKAGPLSDPMLLGTQNRGIISLASTLDTSVAFSVWVGFASTQPVKVQTTTGGTIKFYLVGSQ
jgi:hypothetical protein